VGKLATCVEQEIRRICSHHYLDDRCSQCASRLCASLSRVAPPSGAPSQIAHTLKGTTSRTVLQCFPEIKKQLWGGAFWSRSYYVGIVGDMSVDTVLTSIELGQA
jgi:putative transposase